MPGLANVVTFLILEFSAHILFDTNGDFYHVTKIFTDSVLSILLLESFGSASWPMVSVFGSVFNTSS